MVLEVPQEETVPGEMVLGEMVTVKIRETVSAEKVSRDMASLVQPGSVINTLGQDNKPDSCTNDVHIPCDPRPTMPEMLRLKVPQGTANKYFMLGTILLNDTVGEKMDTIRGNRRGDNDRIVRMILQEWIQGNGKPVTWKTLIRTLRDCELFSLAAEIETTKSDGAVKVPTEKDLAEDLVSLMTPKSMVMLGIQLKLPWDTIENATQDDDHFHQSMTILNEWKKAGTTPYTWDTLITALQSPALNEKRLAKKLQRKYCT
jgi:hypothetical protein